MLILAAVAAFTLPFTAISAVIDLRTYRSRLPPPSAGPGVATTRLPRRALLFGIAASVSLFGLVFSAYTLTSIPGRPGQQGGQGPPGPPGPPDPRIETIVGSMARLAWLEQRYGEFKETRDRYISGTQRHLDLLNAGRTEGKPLPSYSKEYSLTQQMSQMAMDDLGQRISLGEPPRFGSNELNRVTEDFNKAKMGIGQIDTLYNSVIQSLRLQILNFGKAASNPPG